MSAQNTYTVQNSITWAQYFVGNRPLALAGGTEPALTAANIVTQTILQPPFTWRWNRNEVQFLSVDPQGWLPATPYSLGYKIVDPFGHMQTVTTNGVTGATQPAWAFGLDQTTADGTVVWTSSLVSDYSIPVDDFGYIERAYITAARGTPIVTEITNLSELITSDAGTGQTHTIAPVLDDGEGNITFRLMPGMPDQLYYVNIVYQKQPALLTALANPWSIPDRYGSVYNNGFLGMIYLFADDARSAFILQRFAASLIALSEGLSEQQKNAFLEQWDLTTILTRQMSKSNQGVSARSSI